MIIRDKLDLGENELYFGDFNKDGVIQLLDNSALYKLYDSDSESDEYDETMDSNEDGKIQLLDLSAMKENYEKHRTIE